MNNPRFRLLLTILALTTLLAWTYGHMSLEVKTINTPQGEVTYLADPASDPSEKKIIGTNDMVVVDPDGSNLPSKYSHVIDAFGKISMGCTATHVGNGIVISAGHCFKAPKKEKRNAPCRGIKVEWGLRKGVKPYLVSRCDKILSMQLNEDTDYAIIKVSPAPKDFLYVDNSRAMEGREITIFGHPYGRPLEWSDTCTVRNNKNSKYAGVYQFAHQCDTLPGNSGSTILDDSSLEVIGIHDGGIAPWNYGTHILDTPILEFI